MSESQSTTVMISSPLKVWEKIVIIVGEGVDAGTYVGRIEDFSDGGLVVTNPEYISGNTRLRDDLPVMVQITRDDAIYQFASHISRPTSGRADHVLLRAPQKFHRVQRRLFVRIELTDRIDYAPVTSSTDWTLWPKSVNWHEAATRDISGGGLRMVAPEPIEVNSIVLLRLHGGQLDALMGYVFAVCRRTMRINEEDQVGLEFVTADRISRVVEVVTPTVVPTELRRFDRSMQNRLVMWVFHRQIALRQKGLL